MLYRLGAVERTALQAIDTIHRIKATLFDYKHHIRAQDMFYSPDLINNLFTHPHTRIEFIERALNVTRLTATRYLDLLAQDGFLLKRRIGRGSYCINTALTEILTGGPE